MRRHVKASSAGSTLGASRTGIVFACVLSLLAFTGSGASSALAAVPAKGVTGFFGAAGTAAGQLGNPRGVAVNQSSGDVYVLEGGNSRVTVFDSNGKFLRAWGADVVAYGPGQADEVQMVDVAAASGNFTLSFSGKTTPDIPATASAAEVQSALNALSTIGAGGGSVTVTGGPGDAAGSTPYRITFDGGPLAKSNVGQIGAVNVSLAGGSPVTTIAAGTAVDGEVGFEICVPASGDACKAGANDQLWGAFGFGPQGIAVDQSSGDVYVTDQNNRRVQQFDSNGNFIRAFGQGVVASGFPGNQPGPAEVQAITVRGDSGTFKLTFSGSTTPAIAFNASASAVETALNALPSIGGVGGSVTVVGGPGDPSGSAPYTITFGGTLTFEDPPQITIDASEVPLLAVGSTLSCSSSTTATTKSFQWLRNGAPIAAATSATYTTTAADNGAVVQCQVFTLNANAGSTQVSGQQIIPPPAPATKPPVGPGTISAPVLTGALTVGSTPAGAVKLSCQTDSWQGSPTFAYQWYRNGVALVGNGAETNEYTVQTADLGTAAVFQCAVTGSNAGGAAAKVSQAIATSPVPSPAAPGGNAGSPQVTAVARVSETTTTSQGSPPFEICNAAAADVCKAAPFGGTIGGAFGGSTGYPAVAPAGAPNSGNLLVADSGNRRVQEFTSTGSFIRAFGWDVVKAGPSDDETAPINEFEVCSTAAGDTCQAGAAGSGAGQFANNTPTRVAEDSAGAIYTVEPTTNFRVQSFTLPGNVPTPLGTFDEADLNGAGESSAPTDVAVDPATDNVLVTKGFTAGATPSCPITGDASSEESRVLEVSSS
ncbi:MAG TPA: hypothetical protein VMR96_06920, partial [Solirubrobacterales bacterium]|nr:hypothetical protein [Solirubrobacterales bacterium]